MGFSDDNGKLAHDDEYPYQDHVQSQPAFVVEGGQRKSSIVSYPNASDGLNNFVVKTQRVVEVVRPLVTRRVLVNGKPVMEERIVGAYEHGNGLNKNLENLEKVKNFFNQVQLEASMPTAPLLSRPGNNSGARPNWPSQNGTPARSNWGSRAAWMSRDGSPPRYGGEHFEVNRPKVGSRPTYTSYDDDSPPRYHHRPEVSRPISGAKPNWTSRSDSPPRAMVQSGFNSYPNTGARPKWPNSRDDSPPRRMVRPEPMAHPNSGSRPNWPIRDDSPPRAMEYYESQPKSNTRPNWPNARDDSPTRALEYYESHPNYNTKPNWPKARDDSPTRAVEYYEALPNSNTRPNWATARGDSPPKSTVHHLMARPNSDTSKPNWPASNQGYSSPRSMVHPELSHPNSGTNQNWPIRNDSPPRAMEYYESQPKPNARPNWAKARDDSPPKPMAHHSMARQNSNTTRPNWPSNRDYSPPRSMVHPEYVEKGNQRDTSPLHNKLEKVNIHGSRESSPIPNKMNGDKARPGSNVIPNKESSQQVRESGHQKPNWPNRKGQDGKEEHEKPKSNYGGHNIKKGNEEEIHHGLDNPKTLPFDDTKKDDDANYSKKSGTTPSKYMISNNKPNYNGGWYKKPGSNLTSATSNVDDLMKVIEEAKKTGAYPVSSEMPHSITPQGPRISGYSTTVTPQWNQITPNPPPELATQPTINSTEARRRYGYSQPAPMGYYGGALSSEDAVRKYGGTVLPN